MSKGDQALEWFKKNKHKQKYKTKEPIFMFKDCSRSVCTTVDFVRRIYRTMSVDSVLIDKQGMSLDDFRVAFDPETKARTSIKDNIKQLTEEVQIVPDSDFKNKWCHCSSNYWRDAANEFTANQFQYRGKVYWAHVNVIKKCLAELEGAGRVE